MITTASLREYTVKELAEMARRRGVPGWRGMRKDELVSALVKLAKKLAAARNTVARNTVARNTVVTNASRVRSKSASVPPKVSGKVPASRTARHTAVSARTRALSNRTTVSSTARNGSVRSNVRLKNDNIKSVSSTKREIRNKISPAIRPESANGGPSAKLPSPQLAPVRSAKVLKADMSATVPTPSPTSPSVIRELQKMYRERGHRLDLSTRSATPSGEMVSSMEDRIVLMVRDPYWMQAFWEITSRGVSRAQAAMAEWWYTAEPVLRIMEIGGEHSSAASERVVREIAVHGGVQNWFIDVVDPPHTYRAEIGYRSSEGKFFALARSNVVTTTIPGRSETVDHNWSDVAANCDRIFALSGGTSETTNELRELLEHRLRRPMGSPMMTRFGAGAEYSIGRRRDFLFEADAEMIVFGRANPGTHVVLAGEPVKLEVDGSFMVRVSMPERRQVIPMTASSSDGLEQQTIVLAVERNTKVLEHVTRDEADAG